MKVYLLCVIGAMHLIHVSKHCAFAAGVNLFTGHVVDAQNYILRRHDDGFTTGRRQNVVGRHHQCATFQLSFQRQRNVDSHLVAVKVSVISATDQWVQLNSLTFDQYRLKRLNAQTVQCWRSVQHYRVFTNHVRQNIPNFGCLTLDHFLGGLDRGRQLPIF